MAVEMAPAPTGRRDVSMHVPYHIPDNSELITYADYLAETAPADFLKPGRLIARRGQLNMAETIRNLPPDISEDDFRGQTELSCFTECATDLYADQIVKIAKKDGQEWMVIYINKVWRPDEYTHSDPFKEGILEMGWYESEVDQRMEEANEVLFTDGEDYSTMGMSVYQIVQEYLTDRWYKYAHKLSYRYSPEFAQDVLNVGKRETLHTVWATKLTAIQLGQNPELLDHVAAVLIGFRMPGNLIVPEQQAQVKRWMPHLTDIKEAESGLIKTIAKITEPDDADTAGDLLIDLASRAGKKVGPMELRYARPLLRQFRTLIGEAVLHKYVLPNSRPFDKTDYGMFGRMRTKARSGMETLLPDSLISLVAA
ncbi:MAG TPA: hypothetical protein VLE91_03340 [Candidatus Saccharimonadales bacterium]|nr:hypothetical protein [Candidatus Saccharimonadales bacterium]